MAYEYLMSYYLLNKDIRSFMKYVSLGYNLHYEYLPLAFQEAVLYALSLDSREAIEKTTFPIEKTTKDRLYRYIAIYTQYPNARELLKRDFSHTFWYYYPVSYTHLDVYKRQLFLIMELFPFGIVKQN